MPAGHSAHPCLGPWRRRTASGVVLTTVALGMRHTLEDRVDGEAIVVEAPGEPPPPDSPLELHFDPRGPDDTWVVVRPWLLG